MKPNIILLLLKHIPLVGIWAWNRFDLKQFKLKKGKPCEACMYFSRGRDATDDWCMKELESCNQSRGNAFMCGLRGEHFYE